MAYRSEAAEDLDLWRSWERLSCPVLLVHGLLSDATGEETIERMRDHADLSVIRVPETGHTPLLCDFGLATRIADWIRGAPAFGGEVVCRPADTPKRILYASY